MSIEGRSEDTLHLVDEHGNRQVLHPNFFHSLLDTEPVRAWQIFQEENNLRLCIVLPMLSSLNLQTLRTKLQQALNRFNITSTNIVIEQVSQLKKGKTGKTNLINAKPT